MKKQQGFTLIELVVVIVILGILAATALPKFVNLSGDARRSVLDGVQGSMRAANSLIYARSAINGTETAASSSVAMGTATVVTFYGYASTTTELAKAMDLTGDISVVNAGASIGYTNPANCRINYGAAASGALPTYTETTTGC